LRQIAGDLNQVPIRKCGEEFGAVCEEDQVDSASAVFEGGSRLIDHVLN
jgi:hypothetical protein